MSLLVTIPFVARFPDRLQLPIALDLALLLRDLEVFSSAKWTRHFVRANYDGDWSVIPLRGPEGAKHPVQMIFPHPTAKAFENTPFLDGCPYFRSVMEMFQCPLRTVRLMRLTPGSVIKEHSDPDLCFEDGMVRIHVPITTNDDVEFLVNGSHVAMKPGSCWYLRLSDRHSVANKGDTDRVHLVIDAFVNDWITQVFETAASGVRPSL
jgi:hypothetical protein